MTVIAIRGGVEVSTWSVGDSVFIALHKGQKRLSVRVSAEDAKRVAQAIAETARQSR